MSQKTKHNISGVTIVGTSKDKVKYLKSNQKYMYLKSWSKTNQKTSINFWKVTITPQILGLKTRTSEDHPCLKHQEKKHRVLMYETLNLQRYTRIKKFGSPLLPPKKVEEKS